MKKTNDHNWNYEFDHGSAKLAKCAGRLIVLSVTDIVDPLCRLFSGSSIVLTPEESVAFGEEMVRIGKEKIEAHRNGNRFEATTKRSLPGSSQKS